MLALAYHYAAESWQHQRPPTNTLPAGHGTPSKSTLGGVFVRDMWHAKMAGLRAPLIDSKEENKNKIPTRWGTRRHGGQEAHTKRHTSVVLAASQRAG